VGPSYHHWEPTDGLAESRAHQALALLQDLGWQTYITSLAYVHTDLLATHTSASVPGAAEATRNEQRCDNVSLLSLLALVLST
jgi:hypothetical protein